MNHLRGLELRSWKTRKREEEEEREENGEDAAAQREMERAKDEWSTDQRSSTTPPQTSSRSFVIQSFRRSGSSSFPTAQEIAAYPGVPARLYRFIIAKRVLRLSLSPVHRTFHSALIDRGSPKVSSKCQAPSRVGGCFDCRSYPPRPIR